MRTVKVDLGERSYEVRIGQGLVSKLGRYARELGDARRAAVVSDSTVAGLYQASASESLRAVGLAVSEIQFPAGEENKNLQSYAAVMDSLLRSQPPIDRDCIIVGLGGGVTGDMAGFVAATALRGLRLVQCPTTLLSAVDASVGGKTAVDHPCGKNLIGAFHQPSLVAIDVSTLKTLPAANIRDGLAECVKHAAIRDWPMLDFIEANAPAILSADAGVMEELITANVAIKAAVVSADEREAGVRAHLNFGHTVGHAIELLAGLGAMGHGQAVALGMICACGIAQSRGLVNADLRDKITKVLQTVGLATTTGPLDGAKVWAAMLHDKKAKGGKVRMVLPVAPGKVEIFADVHEQEVQRSLQLLASR